MTHHIRAIHGDITVPPEPGSASGTYQVDVSKYILGWMVGTEWFPDAGSLEVDFPHWQSYKNESLESVTSNSSFKLFPSYKSS